MKLYRINKLSKLGGIVLKKKDKGGLNISSTVPLTHIDNDEIRAVMSEWVFSIGCRVTLEGRTVEADVVVADTRSARQTSPSDATPPSTT